MATKKLAMENNGSYEPISDAQVWDSTNGGKVFKFRHIDDTTTQSADFEALRDSGGNYHGFNFGVNYSENEYTNLLHVTGDEGGYIGNYHFLKSPIYNSGGQGATDWVNPTNGLAEGWVNQYNRSATSIVTGNGFSGNAQRTENTDPNYGGRIECIVGGLTIGAKYKLTLKYRTDNVISSGFYSRIGGGFLGGGSYIPQNTGDAILYTDLDSFVADNDEVKLLIGIGNKGDYYMEIDELMVETISNELISWGSGNSVINITYGLDTTTINATTINATNLNIFGTIIGNISTANHATTSDNADNADKLGGTLASEYLLKKSTNTNFVWNDVGTEGYTYNVCIGWGARTHSYNGVSIGRNANAYGNTSVALGYLSYAAGNYSTAVGYGAKTTYDYATAIGRGADALAKYSTAIGYNSYVTTQYEMRLGYSSTTVKLGGGATVTSDVRDKIDVTENELGLDFINSVKTFKWKDNNRDKYFKTKKDEETGQEIRILDDNNTPIIDSERYEKGELKGKRWHRGVVAQELTKVIDSSEFSAVKDTTVNNEQPHLEEMTVDYLQFVAPLIKSVQELSEKVENLEKENKKLKKGKENK